MPFSLFLAVVPAPHLSHGHVFCFVLTFVIELLYVSVTDTWVCMYLNV